MIEYALKDGHLEYGMVHESEQSPQASLKNFLSPLESLRGSQTMKGTAAMAASGTKIKSSSQSRVLAPIVHVPTAPEHLERVLRFQA